MAAAAEADDTQDGIDTTVDDVSGCAQYFKCQTNIFREGSAGDELEVLEDGSTLQLQGEITFGFSRNIMQFLKNHP